MTTLPPSSTSFLEMRPKMTFGEAHDLCHQLNVLKVVPVQVEITSNDVVPSELHTGESQYTFLQGGADGWHPAYGTYGIGVNAKVIWSPNKVL